MGKIIIIAFFVAIALAVMAAPAEEHEPLEFEIKQSQDDEHLRIRRVTCDLLSFGGVVGDSACAANCLSMGKAGGHCTNGICHCRKETFRDVWNERFGR